MNLQYNLDDPTPTPTLQEHYNPATNEMSNHEATLTSPQHKALKIFQGEPWESFSLPKTTESPLPYTKDILSILATQRITKSLHNREAKKSTVRFDESTSSQLSRRSVFPFIDGAEVPERNFSLALPPELHAVFSMSPSPTKLRKKKTKQSSVRRTMRLHSRKVIPIAHCNSLPLIDEYKNKPPPRFEVKSDAGNLDHICLDAEFGNTRKGKKSTLSLMVPRGWNMDRLIHAVVQDLFDGRGDHFSHVVLSDGRWLTNDWTLGVTSFNHSASVGEHASKIGVDEIDGPFTLEYERGTPREACAKFTVSDGPIKPNREKATTTLHGLKVLKGGEMNNYWASFFTGISWISQRKDCRQHSGASFPRLAQQISRVEPAPRNNQRSALRFTDWFDMRIPPKGLEQNSSAGNEADEAEDAESL